MSSRERKTISSTERQRKLSKRAKLLSSLWEPQEVEDRTDTHSSWQSSLQSPVYKIKAIIGERKSEYLIDWADNSSTGETFHPNWQPKANVNKAAIQAWKSERASLPQERGKRTKRPRRRRRHLKQSRDCTTSDISVNTNYQEVQYTGETPSPPPNKIVSKYRQQAPKATGVQSSSLPKSQFPKVTVQVSLHNDFDRDLYIPYQSSIDPIGKVSDHSQSSDSALIKPSQGLAIPFAGASQEDIIVPDSQSPPGSSSYIPTSSKSASSLAVRACGLTTATSPSCNPLGATPSSLDSSIINTSTVSNSIQDSSKVQVPGSQPSASNLQRSQSAPQFSSARVLSSPPSKARPPLLACSALDPSSINETDYQQGVEDSCSTARHGHKVASSLNSRSLSLANRQQELRLPEEEIPRSVDRSLDRSDIVRVYHDGSRSQKRDLPISQLSSRRNFRKTRNSTSRVDALTSSYSHRRTVEIFEVSEYLTDIGHPSQATTTDDSVSSSKDTNSQNTRLDSLEHSSVDRRRGREKPITEYWCSLSTDLTKRLLPTTLDSREPPQPPEVTQVTMSGSPSNQPPLSGGLQDHLGTIERLKKVREENAAKKEAARTGRGHSTPSSARASPSKAMERQLSQPSIGQTQQFPAHVQQQQPLPTATHGWPPLPWAGSAQPMPYVNRASPAPNWAGVLQPLSPVSRASPASNRAVSQPVSPLSRVQPAFSRTAVPQPLAPAPSKLGVNQGPRPGSGPASPSNREQYPIQAQSPGLQSRASTNTPDIIPNKRPYQVQEEPDRLEVPPAMISTELPLPMRSSHSVPHTPATPSRLSMRREASPPQTMTLEPNNLGNMEFIVPLCMQKRILKQYIDTIEFYPASIKENLMEKKISEKSVSNLNDLLCRLANVTTHIGLEGGGPSSQESVRSEQEATYAELSSEKFKFLSLLFEALRGDDLHIAVVAESGPLHDIVELFLKGKRIQYNRPSTYSKSNLGNEGGRLHVSVIASAEEAQPTHFTRNADLVIALDETFKATNQTVVDLREKGNQLTPVIRLLVYSTAEHFDLCLPRTLDPIDRIRKLVFCVWHTQKIVGELQENDLTTEQCAGSVVFFVRRGGHPSFWTLPNIRPIANIPAMDSDSSLSDAMSDVSTKVGKPHEHVNKYWPSRVPATVGLTSTQVSSTGKRPFDLEYGDSLETQAKKQKMAKRAHAGEPVEEPHTVENLEKMLKEVQIREQRLVEEKTRQEETITSFKAGAERRQGAYEDLRDRWSNLHHDKLDLIAENAKLKKELEKARTDRLSLQGERGRLNKDVDDLRQQLLTHPNPTIAATAQQDATIRQLQEDLASQKKKLDFTTTQLEYIREQYQDASHRAVVYLQESEDLQRKVEPLESQLAHERARRKHERENDPRKPLFTRIDNYKVEIETMRRLIVRKEEEIRELKRGRGAGVQTRGSSVQPRSPRGAGSRGVSPAPGAGVAVGGSGGAKGPSGLNRPFNLDG